MDDDADADADDDGLGGLAGPIQSLWRGGGKGGREGGVRVERVCFYAIRQGWNETGINLDEGDGHKSDQNKRLEIERGVCIADITTGELDSNWTKNG
jgi:hypothetical protein